MIEKISRLTKRSQAGVIVMLDRMRSDECYMQLAYEQAQQAFQVDEVPVGAVVVKEGEVIAAAFNQTIHLHDPCAHAEILALRFAGQRLNNYRLPGCTLYVTLEPCLMCAGAMMHARLSRIVFGAYDPKTGVCGSVLDVFSEHRLNHHAVVEGGVLAVSCGGLLKHFFQQRRLLKP